MLCIKITYPLSVLRHSDATRHFNLCTKHITSVYDLLKIEMILQCLLCTNITKSNDVNNVSNVFIAGF